MSQTIKLKRSATAGKIPKTADLELGELAINTHDGKLYTKKNDDTVIELGGGGDNQYTAGTGIDITGNVISSTVKSAGTVIGVQIGDGSGNFVMVPQQEAGRVLTSNGTQSPTWEPVPVSGGTVRSIDVGGGETGLSFSGGPVKTTGTITMAGTLAVANGGTGKTTASEAINALVPTQTGNTGKYLTTNGTIVSWGNAGAGTVTSVAVSGGTTGLTTTGSPVTSNGTIALAGTLAIANGGTGATTAAAAINALVPKQSAASGKFLTSDGTAVSWGTPVSPPGGATTQVQYNDAGVLSGAATFTFNKATNTLSVPSLTTTSTVELSGGVFSSAVAVPAAAVDCSKGVYFTKTVSSANTWTFTNAPIAGKSYIFALALTNGGSAVQTWPAGTGTVYDPKVVWPSGTAPTLSTGTAVVDMLIFSTSDGGATWRGSSILNYSA